MTIIRRDKAAIKARLERDKRRAENPGARAYLVTTDWYVIRLVETGEPVPADVTAKRAAARRALSE